MKNTSESTIQLTTFWRFAVRLREGFEDAQAHRLKSDIADLGILRVKRVSIAQVYYCGGSFTSEELRRIGELLIDPITQEYDFKPVELSLTPQTPSFGSPSRYTVEVAYHPGVRDPVEDSLKKGTQDLGIKGLRVVHAAQATTLEGSLDPKAFARICEKLLMNSTIQQVVTPENLRQLLGSVPTVAMPIETVHLLSASDTVLQRVSLDYQLSLNLEEMRAIQAIFRQEAREPTLIELETIAQTWSEHCKHKTFRGLITYTKEVNGKTDKKVIHNLLKSTIMRVTEELQRPWCISVFEDNSGVIAFDDEFHLCFKVETHNHPSALEPFGGASTGIGGVIRDILGTGRAAKPVASTDVFCFAPPDLALAQIPPGTLHPRRVMKGVVAGVKDYGNKMGIPTVNGSVLFDERFVGNPLVYCGTVGLIPRERVTKKVAPGMQILLMGGRTGRDGIHGATFSSLTLSAESETLSSTAVQIGDPITEKKVADCLMQAREEDLFSSITDCGAGGLSSAVGEMAASCGAKVSLEKVPLKYAGLTPTEIWISESQERMVLAVPMDKLEHLVSLCQRYHVEATPIGEFTDSGKLELFFQGHRIGELKMSFLHEGVPQVSRPARWIPPALTEPNLSPPEDLTSVLFRLLGRWETCSKEWIIRQYDHEVQGGSVIKPLVGVHHQGPSDAAVLRPRLDSSRGIALANGINFRYSDLDPYWMAAAVVDEAVRQIIAVGGSLDLLALLDNFCWGDPTRVEVLGSLVRAAEGCSAAAKAFGTPFISGKDSLHNEYKVGEKTIQIPGTLLISSIGVLPDVTKTVSMDAKRAGDLLYLVGLTKEELGGSAYYALHGAVGVKVPQVDFSTAPSLFKAVAEVIRQGLVAAAHDCSEGGLAVAAAEMAFSGGRGVTIHLDSVRTDRPLGRDDLLLFSESTTRLLLEVPPEKQKSFEEKLKGLPVSRIGQFEEGGTFRVLGLSGKRVVEATIEKLKEAWQQPFQGW